MALRHATALVTSICSPSVQSAEGTASGRPSSQSFTPSWLRASGGSRRTCACTAAAATGTATWASACAGHLGTAATARSAGVLGPRATRIPGPRSSTASSAPSTDAAFTETASASPDGATPTAPRPSARPTARRHRPRPTASASRTSPPASATASASGAGQTAASCCASTGALGMGSVWVGSASATQGTMVQTAPCFSSRFEVCQCGAEFRGADCSLLVPTL
mmetsp:Transcript_7942/g.24128  ORF Transcript_7942/g.24128 Transcript_7942/m.24128 type:complete len:222 (+) Transcript_7942:1247-1912(+)